MPNKFHRDGREHRPWSRTVLLISILTGALLTGGQGHAQRVKIFRMKPAQSTICLFNLGPRAGTKRDLSPMAPLPLGAVCKDGAGSTGVIVASIGVFPPKLEAPHVGPPTLDAVKPVIIGEPLKMERAPVPVTGSDLPVSGKEPSMDSIQKTPGKVDSVEEARMGQGPAPGPISGQGPTDLVDASEEAAFEKILKRAKNGGIQYNVPKSMMVGQPVSVVAEVDGASADAGVKDQFQATGSGTLKVTPIMLVTLTAPDNPDAFKIEPSPDSTKSGEQFILDSSMAQWVWTVTPLQGGGSPKNLKIEAYMVLNAKLPDGRPIQNRLISYTVPVPIEVKPRLKTARDFLAANWMTLLGYIVPSGAGVGFIAWLLARRKSNARA